MKIVDNLEAEARKKIDAAQATIEEAKDKLEAKAKKEVGFPLWALVAAGAAARVVIVSVVVSLS